MIKLQKIMAEEKSPDAQSLLLNIVSNSRRLDLKKVYDPPPHQHSTIFSSVSHE